MAACIRCCVTFPCSYVIEDGSPYMRSGKQGSGGRGGGGGKGGGGSKSVMDDQGDDQWGFSSFCKKDFVKDSIPDQQLGLAELTMRFKGQRGSGTPHWIILATFPGK